MMKVIKKSEKYNEVTKVHNGTEFTVYAQDLTFQYDSGDRLIQFIALLVIDGQTYAAPCISDAYGMAQMVIDGKLSWNELDGNNVKYIKGF